MHLPRSLGSPGQTVSLTPKIRGEEGGRDMIVVSSTRYVSGEGYRRTRSGPDRRNQSGRREEIVFRRRKSLVTKIGVQSTGTSFRRCQTFLGRNITVSPSTLRMGATTRTITESLPSTKHKYRVIKSCPLTPH